MAINRRYIQDIVAHKKTLEQSRQPTQQPTTASSGPVVEAEPYEEPTGRPNLAVELGRIPGTKRSKPWLRWGTVVVLIAVILGVFLASAFAKATVTVNPKSISVPATSTYEASKEPEGGDLAFYTMTELQDQESVAVTATGFQDVSQKAKGTITVSNSFSTAAQPLIATTRFETSDGRIYRIPKSVTVPGMKGSAPGTIDVEVVADQAGEKYNLSQGTFVIPGFKGTTKYDKFSAAVKTPITGGFVGKAPVVSKADREKAVTDLQNTLVGRLVKKAKANIPEGFVLYDGAVIVKFADWQPPTSADDKTAKIGQIATLTGFMFKQEDLAREIAKTSPDYDSEPVKIMNPNDLVLTLSNRDKLDARTAEKIAFSLSGTAKLNWVIDQAALKSRLVGQPKASYQSVFAQFPAIEKANVKFVPPWVRSFPDSTDRIDVILEELAQ